MTHQTKEIRDAKSSRRRGWRKRIKDMMIKCMGNGCNRCGYNQCHGALDFHHLKDKKVLLSSLIYHPSKSSELLEEAKKCILLCKNCHSELHNKVWNISDIKIFIFDESSFTEKEYLLENTCICGKIFYSTSKVQKYCNKKCQNVNMSKIKSRRRQTSIKKNEKFKKECPICKNEYYPKIQESKFCSNKCSAKSKERVTRPSKEELQNMVLEKPTQDIAMEYGVSDKTIAKWCKKMKITKPTRGYWTKIQYNKIIPG